MEVSDFKKLNFTVLGKDSELEGHFKFSGDILLGAQLKGSISMLDQGKVIIERTSTVNADIKCHDIEIFGSFTGSIVATGTLCVRSSAHVSGQINAHSLSVSPGAQLNIEGHTDSSTQ